MFNKFNTESFVVVQKAYSEPLAEDGTLTFTIDSAPISAPAKNRFQLPSERELKTYQLIGQSQDRVTQGANLLEKIISLQSRSAASPLRDNDGDDKPKEEDSESDEIGAPVNRYFSDVNSFDVMTKGVCRRCKKAGHFEKWCTEESQEVGLQCKFCLGNHFHMRCTNTLCYKCNQFGHMAKTCEAKALKCRRCEKIGHKAADCGVIIEDKDWPSIERNNLKKLKCLNCLNKGHVNCADFNLQTFRANSYKDTIYSDKLLPLKQQSSLRLSNSLFSCYNRSHR